MATPACPSKVASVLRGGESNTAAGLGAASLGRRGFVRKASVEEEPVATPTPPSLREAATPERAAKTRRSGEATLEEALAEIMNEAVGVSPSSPPEKIGASRGERSSGVGGARPEMEAVGRGCPVFEFLAGNVLLHDMGVGVIVSLQRELGDRAEQTVNESWSQEWYGWTELAGQISEVQGLEDETVALELAGLFCAEKVRTFLLLVAQNADVPMRTDEERLAELRRDGFERRVGRVWGRNDCMADSLLQLLMAHGVLATDITDVERDAACEANRRELVHSDLPNRRPRDLRGRDDPRAFLEHDRHAQATVDFFALVCCALCSGTSGRGHRVDCLLAVRLRRPASGMDEDLRTPWCWTRRPCFAILLVQHDWRRHLWLSLRPVVAKGSCFAAGVSAAAACGAGVACGIAA